MNKTIGYIAIGICSLILASFAVVQQIAIDKLDAKLEEKETALKQKGKSLSMEMQTSDRLRSENSLLIDSINVLNVKINDLNILVEQQEAIIKKLDGKINRRENKFEELEKKISWLEKDQIKNAARIKELEAEKTDLLKQIEDFSNKKAQLERQLEEDKKLRMEAQLAQDELQKKNLVTHGTWVTYHEIDLRKKPHRGDISKISDSGENWKYTAFNFSLGHHDNAVLLDQEFVLKIVDTDTGEILPLIETNPLFPENESKLEGRFFRYQDNPIELMYVNTQEKRSKNYEVRIYYVNANGQHQLLENSKRPIVKSGKPFSL